MNNRSMLKIDTCRPLLPKCILLLCLALTTIPTRTQAQRSFDAEGKLRSTRMEIRTYTFIIHKTKDLEVYDSTITFFSKDKPVVKELYFRPAEQLTRADYYYYNRFGRDNMIRRYQNDIVQSTTSVSYDSLRRIRRRSTSLKTVEPVLRKTATSYVSRSPGTQPDQYTHMLTASEEDYDYFRKNRMLSTSETRTDSLGNETQIEIRNVARMHKSLRYGYQDSVWNGTHTAWQYVFNEDSTLVRSAPYETPLPDTLRNYSLSADDGQAILTAIQQGNVAKACYSNKTIDDGIHSFADVQQRISNIIAKDKLAKKMSKCPQYFFRYQTADGKVQFCFRNMPELMGQVGVEVRVIELY
ncbi:MAG: hypothetical protein EOP49_20775 [Sphingobacteriales bacterium]|nr:MAG: hypothetical protein EOP49_20775 [Sphingobacteriales bacterium]